MDNVLNLTFASSLTKLCEINSSFDSGMLRIAYPGLNRNGSFISKETFEKCVKTIFNCPVVCHYDRETDTLGGHDMELVRDASGMVRLVNLTTPVGLVPESAHWQWCDFEEEDGTVHEYLCVDVLLWKRQEAYQKIKEDGITAHSMEITVKSGERIDGVYYIYDFEFTAFALIGVAPCFEGSALETFAKQDFKQQLSDMMQELKESFSSVTTSQEDDNIHPQNDSMEGGEKVLDEKMELVAMYGIDVDNLDFSLEDFTVEELKEKFEAMKQVDPAQDGDPAPQNDFALSSNISEELCRAIESVKIQREWGECCRYWYVDYDADVQEVYCWEVSDWLLYGFHYEMNGDSVVIDFESKKRKKYVIADFDEGEQPSPFVQVFAQMEQKLHDDAEWEAKYQTASHTIESMEEELDQLRQFKQDTVEAQAKADLDAVFERFTDLNGVDAFEALRTACDEDCMKYDVETLEEKCFAIRGRNGSAALFSHDPKTTKLKVDKEASDFSDSPYGGIVEKYLGRNK